MFLEHEQFLALFVVQMGASSAFYLFALIFLRIHFCIGVVGGDGGGVALLTSAIICIC
jgi:hypothetical protein